MVKEIHKSSVGLSSIKPVPESTDEKEAAVVSWTVRMSSICFVYVCVSLSSSGYVKEDAIVCSCMTQSVHLYLHDRRVQNR